MFEKNSAKNILNLCLKTGADFAEIYYENTITNSLKMISGKISEVGTSNLYGAGIRILKGVQEVYGYTNDSSEEGLQSLVNELITAFNDTQRFFCCDLKERKKPNNVVLTKKSKDISNSQKTKYLEICSQKMTDYSDKIIQAVVNFNDETQEVTIVNSQGLIAYDTRNHQRIFAIAVAKDENGMQQAANSLGGNTGCELFTDEKLEDLALESAKSAVTMLTASEMIGGTYDVVIHNGFGGVIFHEACGHSLEATSVAKGLSVFCNKVGQKIASDCVTAIDDGTILNAWGSENIDDEGHITQKNVLIENGILKSYMIDMRNGLRMQSKATGNSRRQSYRYSPTSRMTNTYIANGKSTIDEIIEQTEFGLFAKSMGGGSVNPATGEFNFTVNEGYMIRDGKLCEPVRGAALIGNGANTLLNIDMVGNNCSFGHGMCGSASGSIPANVGQPTIRVKQMTVGGTGGNK